MSEDRENSEGINKDSDTLTTAFNMCASEFDPNTYQDQLIERQHKANINLAAASGGTAYFANADTFQFNLQRDEELSFQKTTKGKDRFLDQVLLRQYLQDLQNILDQLDKNIQDLIKRIEERGKLLSTLGEEYDQNEQVIEAINVFMKQNASKHKDNGPFESDLINHLILISGYDPANISDAQARKILDQSTIDLRHRQAEITHAIHIETKEQEKDIEALDRKQRQREKIARVNEQIKILADRKDLSFEEKNASFEQIKVEENLSKEDLDAIQNELEDSNHDNAAVLMAGGLTLEGKLEKSENIENETNAFDAFMLKP